METTENPWIDRQALQTLLGVGRRRAQQLMQPLASQVIGRNLLVGRERFREFLLATAAGQPAGLDHQRRLRFAHQIDQWARTPRLPVEAPARIIHQQLASLPPGIELAPSRITITFTNSHDAMEKMLALALAISNDLDGFENATTSA